VRMGKGLSGPSPADNDGRHRQPRTAGDANDHCQIPKRAVTVKPRKIKVVQTLIEPAIQPVPQGLATDSVGNLYISDWSAAVRVVSAGTGIITRLAGNGYCGYSGDGDSATVASLYLPEGIALDASDDLYIADSYNYRVREISAASPTAAPIISPASGTYTSIQMATITDSSNSAVIYYTADGTAPTNTSTVYSGLIAISVTTLQVIAIPPALEKVRSPPIQFSCRLRRRSRPRHLQPALPPRRR
jgi:hypothetical protein